MNTAYTKELSKKKTLYVSQCCDLKVETTRTRTWICRGNGKISVEHLRKGKWELDLDHGVEVK